MFHGSRSLLLFTMLIPGCIYIDRISPKQQIAVTRTTLHLLAHGLQSYHRDGGEYPATAGAFVSLSMVLGNALVDGGYVRAVNSDTWGNTIAFWSDGFHFIIASAGPNQRSDFDYSEQLKTPALPSPQQLCELAMSPSNDDLLVMDGEHCPDFPLEQAQK